jgi:hypothetical protein
MQSPYTRNKKWGYTVQGRKVASLPLAGIRAANSRQGRDRKERFGCLEGTRKPSGVTIVYRDEIARYEVTQSIGTGIGMPVQIGIPVSCMDPLQ